MRIKVSLVLLQLLVVGVLSAQSLSGTWAFKTDVFNIGRSEKWYSPALDVSSWDTMNVPGCWDTRLDYSDYVGVAWYRREVAPIGNDANSDLILDFEAAYNDVTVWVNGQEVGSHDFGFTRFKFDVTDKIKSDEPNIIVVRVDNSFKLGATWNWGGLRRGVEIHKLPKYRLERVAITATPELKNGSAQVDIRVMLKGGKQGVVTLQIMDPQQKVVATKRVTVNATDSSLLLSTKLKKADLWSFDYPNLYSAQITLQEQGKTLSVINERFGVRKIEVDGYRLLLNGQSVRLNGANYVPYDRFTGSVLPEHIFKRDIDMMKSCGVNMARLSHLALPKDVLDYIDEKGILIFEEIPLWNKNHYVKANHPVPMRWLTELITERYNHPCIIGWSVGNEIGRLSDNPDIAGYLSSAFKHVKSLDSTRLSVYVSHTAAKQDNEPVLLSDMILFNQYGAHGERADRVHATYPGKPIFYCEYGTKVNREDLNNTTVDLSAMVEGMRGREFLIGASVWTFNDYRSNYKDGATSATQNRAWGVVDAYGRKKRAFAQLQKQNSPLKRFEISAQNSVPTVKISLELTPREKFDLPAFDMVGYSVKVKLFDKNDSELNSKILPLPTITVASKPVKLDLDITQADVAKITAELISPTKYAVDECVKYFVAPSAPAISYTESAQSQIRVFFDRNPLATQWYVRYGADSINMVTEPTINNYIDVSNLEFGRDYKFVLVASNGAAQTESQQVVTARTMAAELPPVITHLQLLDDNIQVGYHSSNDEFIYEFEYGLSPDALTRSILTTAPGACNLPVISSGQTHYLRIRMRLRYGYASEWSRLFTVTELPKK